MNNIELFYNEKNEYVGFAGNIKVKNKEIYVNTKTGAGYDKVIEILQKMISYLSTKFTFDGFNKEDIKQHIVVKILEGIPKFNPNKNIKLCSFLQLRISRRLINEIRDCNRFKNNATTLSIKNFKYSCKCGNVIISNSDNEISKCDICKRDINKRKKLWIKNITISYNSVLDGYLDNSMSNAKKIEKMDIIKCLDNENEDIKNIINLMYYQDMPAKDVAKKMGISTSSIYVKIKNLKNNVQLKNLMRG